MFQNAWQGVKNFFGGSQETGTQAAKPGGQVTPRSIRASQSTANQNAPQEAQALLQDISPKVMDFLQKFPGGSQGANAQAMQALDQLQQAINTLAASGQAQPQS